MIRRTLLVACSLAVLLGSLANRSSAEDWPGWLGSRRDSVVRETGWLKSIPASGLKTLWRTPISGGYAGPAVAGGRVIVTDYVVKSGENTYNSGARDRIEGTERVLCLDAETGKQLWKHEYDRPYNISYGTGPRATPMIDGDRVYTLGAEGDLLCLAMADGKVQWSKSLNDAYKGETPLWGHAAHPLVHGDLLFVLGGKDSVAVALDKHTGQEKWHALTASDIGYCAPSIAQLPNQQNQLLIWTPETLNGLDPQSGKVLWSTPLKPSYGMSIAVPRASGRQIFAGGIGEVGALFEVAADGNSVKELWRGKAKTAVYPSNAPAFFDGKTLYAADNGSGKFIAASAEDGTRLWETFEPTSGGTRRASHGTAFVVQNEDKFWLFSETGDLILAELTPQAYRELGRAHVIEPTSDAFGRPVVWTHPAYANRHAFIRNDKEIICVDLAAH